MPVTGGTIYGYSALASEKGKGKREGGREK
jgi:hypothetical protein